MKEMIRPAGSPDWELPLTPGVATETLVFVGGHTALEAGGSVAGLGDVRAQTRRVLDKIGAVLDAAGGTMADIVQTTVWIADRDDFAAMNEVYGEYFADSPPARATVVSTLVLPDLLVEITAIAVRSGRGQR